MKKFTIEVSHASSPQLATIALELNIAMETLDKKTNQQPGFSAHQDGWQKVRDGINFFRQYFAKQYMVLLD